MTDWQIEQLIFDWNLEGEVPAYPTGVMITDETLRDGLQSPSIIHPPIQDKVYLLYLMNDLGIDSADIGLPGAGERFKYDVTVLAREIASHRLNIRPNCAAR
ncbi:MAG: 2-isopropylmalate synthase, partial [Chloroflexota bacterium]